MSGSIVQTLAKYVRIDDRGFELLTPNIDKDHRGVLYVAVSDKSRIDMVPGERTDGQVLGDVTDSMGLQWRVYAADCGSGCVCAVRVRLLSKNDPSRWTALVGVLSALRGGTALLNKRNSTLLSHNLSDGDEPKATDADALSRFIVLQRNGDGEWWTCQANTAEELRQHIDDCLDDVENVQSREYDEPIVFDLDNGGVSVRYEAKRVVSLNLEEGNS